MTGRRLLFHSQNHFSLVYIACIKSGPYLITGRRYKRSDGLLNGLEIQAGQWIDRCLQWYHCPLYTAHTKRGVCFHYLAFCALHHYDTTMALLLFCIFFTLFLDGGDYL